MYKRHCWCCVSCDVSDVSHRSARASPSRRAGGEPAVAPRRSCPPAPPRRARIEPEMSAGPAGRRREPRGQPTRRTIDSRKDRASCRRHDARLAGRRDRICARRGDFRTLTSTPATCTPLSFGSKSLVSQKLPQKQQMGFGHSMVGSYHRHPPLFTQNTVVSGRTLLSSF